MVQLADWRVYISSRCKKFYSGQILTFDWVVHHCKLAPQFW